MKTSVQNMNQSLSQNKVKQLHKAAVTFVPARTLQELSHQEVIAVAGGPEGGVGTGMNPPVATVAG